MEVTLGGVPLERSGRSLVFLLPEAEIPELRRDAKGELSLRIRILR